VKVSIVMTAYKRAPQLKSTLKSIFSQTFKDFEVIVVEDGSDGGNTQAVCECFPVKYFQRTRRPGIVYSNPAVPMNIGIKRAEGEITILQNAECRHFSPELIWELSQVGENEVLFASVRTLDQAGTNTGWYSHPKLRREPWFFCGAVHTKHLQYMRGVDEDYIGYGMDDVDLADRLKARGLEFRWSDTIIAEHQWHESYHGQIDYSLNAGIYEKKSRDFTIVRNPEKWGELE
jgi:glycosyltransferase involved in cell wall biosynthesis